MNNANAPVTDTKKKHLIIGVLVSLAFLFLSMTLTSDRLQGAKKEKAFTTQINDSVSVDIYLVYDNNSDPMKYYSQVITPVCEEGLCYVITLDVYWDLLGHFLTYEELPEDPLTKFDHVKLTKSDHKKLKKILSDKNSLLKNYEAKDLVDKSVKIRSKAVVDAVAGATYPALEGAVVKGAVYSSYTLWHIVNGKVAEDIVANTETLVDDGVLISMLRSDNYNLQFYALNKINVADQKFVPYIIELISEGDSYVPFFAVDKLNDRTWNSPKHQERIIGLLKKVDFEMQNEILNRIKDRELGTDALKVLISNLKSLDERQQQRALKVIDRDKISYDILHELASLLSPKDSVLSNSIYRILDSKGKIYDDIKESLKKYEQTEEFN